MCCLFQVTIGLEWHVILEKRPSNSFFQGAYGTHSIIMASNLSDAVAGVEVNTEHLLFTDAL